MRKIRDFARLVIVGGGIVLWMAWLAPGVSAAEGDAAKGKEVFANMCASCHGNAGKGDGPAAAALNPKPKNMTDKAYMAKLDDKYLHDVIAKGGPGVGKSPTMPPFGGSLKEADIRNLIALIRSLAK